MKCTKSLSHKTDFAPLCFSSAYFAFKNQQPDRPKMPVFKTPPAVLPILFGSCSGINEKHLLKSLSRKTDFAPLCFSSAYFAFKNQQPDSPNMPVLKTPPAVLPILFGSCSGINEKHVLKSLSRKTDFAPLCFSSAYFAFKNQQPDNPKMPVSKTPPAALPILFGSCSGINEKHVLKSLSRKTDFAPLCFSSAYFAFKNQQPDSPKMPVSKTPPAALPNVELLSSIQQYFSF